LILIRKNFLLDQVLRSLRCLTVRGNDCRLQFGSSNDDDAKLGTKKLLEFLIGKNIAAHRHKEALRYDFWLVWASVIRHPQGGDRAIVVLPNHAVEGRKEQPHSCIVWTVS